MAVLWGRTKVSHSESLLVLPREAMLVELLDSLKDQSLENLTAVSKEQTSGSRKVSKSVKSKGYRRGQTLGNLMDARLE
jgi:hypothetical protein